MTHISGRNFGQLLGNPVLNSGFTSSAGLAEISAMAFHHSCQDVDFGPFWVELRLLLPLCYFSFHEIPCYSILFYDRACNGFTRGAYFPSS